MSDSRKAANGFTSNSTSASASSIETAEIRIDSATNWMINCFRVAPRTLRSATSRARWLARAVARFVKFTTWHVRSIVPFPCRELVPHRINVAAGADLEIDPAGLTAPAGQELRVSRVEGLVIPPHDGVDLHVRILRQVLEHRVDLEVAL